MSFLFLGEYSLISYIWGKGKEKPSPLDVTQRCDLFWSTAQASCGRLQLPAMTQNYWSWEADIFKNWREELEKCIPFFWLRCQVLVPSSGRKWFAGNFFLVPSNPLKLCVQNIGPDSWLYIPQYEVAAVLCNSCMLLWNLQLAGCVCVYKGTLDFSIIYG